ncbi:Uncharacterized protein C1orf94, partial [Podiceps cristatus]
MKLKALCDAQLSAKPIITSLLCSAKSPKNSKGLEGGRVAGACSLEDSKPEVPLLLKHTQTARGAGNQVQVEKAKVVKEFTQNSVFSSAKSSTAVSLTAAVSQVTGQRPQLPPFGEICSKKD